MSDKGFDLQKALDSTSVAGTLKNVLGIAYESKVCDCGGECRETTVFDARTAAFHQGETPAWECKECGKTFYRGSKQENHTLDLYGRGD